MLCADASSAADPIRRGHWPARSWGRVLRAHAQCADVIMASILVLSWVYRQLRGLYCRLDSSWSVGVN